MKIIHTDFAPIVADQEGDHYVFIGETVYYLNEFMKTLGNRDFDGVTHITNAGGIGIKIDEVNEQVKYTIFTT
tara:strand:+ start:80 stop:298 length:219 start_codon:yes stop_codon:yes gene_type:complete